MPDTTPWPVRSALMPSHAIEGVASRRSCGSNMTVICITNSVCGQLFWPPLCRHDMPDGHGGSRGAQSKQSHHERCADVRV